MCFATRILGFEQVLEATGRLLRREGSGVGEPGGDFGRVKGAECSRMRSDINYLREQHGFRGAESVDILVDGYFFVVYSNLLLLYFLCVTLLIVMASGQEGAFPGRG